MRASLVFVALLAAATASPQSFPPDTPGGGGGYDGGAVSNPFLAPTGCSPLGYAYDGDSDTGMCQNGADSPSFRAGGTEFLRYIGGTLLELIHPVAGSSATIITNGISGGGGSTAGRIEMRQHAATSLTKRIFIAPHLAVETTEYNQAVFQIYAPNFTSATQSTGLSFDTPQGIALDLIERIDVPALLLKIA